MVFVEMSGRCGNQLFHYACGRYIQIKNEDNQLILNYNSILKKNRKSEGWYDCLADFNTVTYSYYDREGTILKNETNIIQKMVIAIKAFYMRTYDSKSREYKAENAYVLQKTLNRLGVYWIREGVEKIYPYRRKKSIVTGVCESPSIFEEIGDILRLELTPKEPVLEENKELIYKIENTNSVCISVRRGDFFNNKNEKSFAVCTPKYYVDAKNIIENNNMEKTTYFIFSDDIEWCKENLPLKGDVTYVSQNMPVYETLRLMYSCKNFILSNSTFSWWGYFLSNNKDKIVISPSRWNNDGFKSKLIDDKWILLDT